MKQITLLTVAMVILLLSSCASIISGTNQKITINSNPPGATVKVDTAIVGKTPLVTKLKVNQPHTVTMTAEGYPPYTAELKPKFNAVTLGNILLGGIIGILVDAGTGAINTLKPNKINHDFNAPAPVLIKKEVEVIVIDTIKGK